MNSKRSSESSRRPGRRPYIVIGLAIVAVISIGLALGELYYSGFRDRDSTRYGPETSKATLTRLAPPTHGGPFSLIDHQGRPVSDEDFRGRFMLVFFGYTYCPDVCPTELATMALVMDILGPAGETVQPLFISVDPERDTVELLGDYVAAFHPRLIGLTGSPEQIAAAAKVYNAFYMKVPLPSDEGGTGADGDNPDYGVAHSASIYLVGPDGRMLATYPRGLSPEELAKDIRRFLEGGA